jgi:hypothetical protein
MESEQTANSTANRTGFRINSSINQRQTHSFEQLSVNPADGSYQYSSGYVTTGTKLHP